MLGDRKHSACVGDPATVLPATPCYCCALSPAQCWSPGHLQVSPHLTFGDIGLTNVLSGKQGQGHAEGPSGCPPASPLSITGFFLKTQLTVEVSSPSLPAGHGTPQGLAGLLLTVWLSGKLQAPKCCHWTRAHQEPPPNSRLTCLPLSAGWSVNIPEPTPTKLTFQKSLSTPPRTIPNGLTCPPTPRR